MVRKKQTTDRVISNLEKISEGATKKSRKTDVDNAIKELSKSNRAITNLQKISESNTRKSRKTDVDNAIKELSKSNRAITNIEKLSKNNVKKDKNLDVELEHMRFAFREHTKDSYENLISSAKKKQKQSNFKAALAMHELDKRGVQPHMTDIENELSNMMQPKQKLKASDAAKLNMSTLVSPQTARVLDMTGGPARRFTPTTPTAPQVVDTRDIAATRLQRVIRGHSGRTKATTQLENKVGKLEKSVEATKLKANDILGDTLRQNKQKLEKKYSNRVRDKLSATKQAKLEQGIQQYADIIIAKKRGPKPK